MNPHNACITQLNSAIDFWQALDLDPHNAIILSNRSLCWMRTGQLEFALTDAKLVRQIRPDWAKGCYREGSALRLLQVSIVFS